MLVCLVAFAGLSASAQTGVVFGIVANDRGQGVAGVEVILDNPGIAFHQRTVTGADGRFRFREVPPASAYQVSVVLQGKALPPRSLNLNVDEQKEVWPPLYVLPPAERPADVPDASNPLFASAEIYGRILDATGRPVAAAEVRLENAARGFSKTLTTGEDGSYRFTAVPPGDGYRLIASKKGVFGDWSPIELFGGDDKLMPFLRLIPDKAVSAEVGITSVSGVITGEQLRALPLYNRNFLALGLLAPQVHEVEQGSELAGASFSIGGSRPSSNNFLLDGTDNVASGSNQAVPFQVNDSIQEFRVIASNAPAEFGRNAGGIVNVATRRGTRSLHGEAYGYFANDALSADRPLSVYNGTTFDQAAAYAGTPVSTPLGTGPPPAADGAYFPLRYNDYVNIARNNGFCTDSIAVGWTSPSTCVTNGRGANTFFDPVAILATRDKRKEPFDSRQFGVSLGGPLQKDKLFAFGSYEGTLINNPRPIFERVPSSLDTIYNPHNRPTSFASLPSVRNMFSANDPNYMLAQQVLKLFPSPNVVGVPGALEFYQGEAPNYTHVHNVLLRSDWSKSAVTSASIRYVTQSLQQLHDDSLPKPADKSGYPGNGALRHAFNQNLSIAVKRTLFSGMINESRVGVNRFNLHETAQDTSFDARTLGLAGSSLPGSALPTFILSGLDPRYSGAYIGVNGAFGSWAEVLNGTRCPPGKPCNVGLLQGLLGLPNPSPMAPSLDGQFPFARLGAPLTAPSARIDTTLEFANTTSFGHGDHDLKVGLNVRQLKNQIRQGGYQRGFVYSGNIGEFTHDSGTCNEVCTDRIFTRNAAPNAFFRPSFDFSRTDSSPLQADFSSWALAAFVQDSWRIAPRLTLNLGVRYELTVPAKERFGKAWNFDETGRGLLRSKGAPEIVDPFGNLCGASGAPVNGLFPDGGKHLVGATQWTGCGSPSRQELLIAQHTDIAPRIGVAWDVRGDGKTIIRAGAGLFWDQVPGNVLSQLAFNRPVDVDNAVYGQIIDPGACPALVTGGFRFIAENCGLGNAMLSPSHRNLSDLDTNPSDGTSSNGYFTEASFPFAVYARDRSHSGTPLALQSNLTMQRQLSYHLIFEAGYIGTLGRRLPVVFNAQAVPELSFTANDVPMRVFPVFTMSNRAESSYHSLLARLRAAQWHGLRVNTTYVYSRARDNAAGTLFQAEPVPPGAIAVQKSVASGNPGSACFFGGIPFVTECIPTAFPNIDLRTGGALTTTGAGQVLVSRYSFPQDSANFLADDYGPSDFDTAHRVVIDYTWDVPALRKGRSWAAWLDHWTVGGILVAQSGQPFTIFAAPPSAAELTQRVNLVGRGPSFNFSNPSAAITVTPTNGVAPALQACDNKYLINNFTQQCIGGSGRNMFTGPAYVNLDIALQKEIPLRDDRRVFTVRGELYNVFNKANFYNPISNYSVDGVNPNPDFGTIKSSRDPVRAQFALRFRW